MDFYSQKTEKKNIVILGAGFGGLRAAILLGKKIRKLNLLQKYEVFVVDRNEHQLYTPLLYEVATTSKETADLYELHGLVAYNLHKLLKKSPVSLVRGEIESIDVAEKKIGLAGGRTLSCDYCIIALGAEANYFGVEGLKENATALKTFRDAIEIRDRIWNLAAEKKGHISVVIGGGGSTGVELAGELKEWCGELEKEFRACRLDVTIVEASPSILPGFSGKVIRRVRKRLDALKIKIMENETIESVEKGKVNLKNDRQVAFDVFVWAGGVKASSVLAKLPLKTPRGRLEVAAGMACLPQSSDLKIQPAFYAIGDNTCLYDPETKKPVPGVARAAILGAGIAAHNIIEEIKAAENKNCLPHIAYYLPKEYPYVIPVGGKFAVAKIGPFVISGFFGWLLKGLVELNYLISIMPVSRALAIWLKGLKIFIQNDRLG